MKFIGDQGWFYLAARDLLLTGKIPLVGITSSHTWLHQGPLWTYILSIALFLGKFNPISGGYVTALFGALSAVLMYKLGLAMFSRRVGVIAALLYGTSPLVIFFDRMPYHTSLIPFFTLLYFFALFKWLKGSIKYFPLILLSLAILYNLELATFALSFPFAVFIVYGFIKNKTWFKKLFNKKILMLSFISLLVPMLPVIIYDFSHGFKQTIVFFGWTLYKPFSFLVKHSSGNLLLNSVSVFNFLTVNLQKIIFQFNFEIAILIFSLSIIYLFHRSIKNFKVESSWFILTFLLIVSLAGILINQTPSDAYLPITFPLVVFTVALFFDYLCSIRIGRLATLTLLSLIILLNSYCGFIISQGNEFMTRMEAADAIIKLAGRSNYNLIGRGAGSQFASFTMNYEYLLWWKGYPLSKKNEKLKIVVMEERGRIFVYKK
jgi:4-amino-4-deoxy-L-arabinose transferase-like glycosyltransferase